MLWDFQLRFLSAMTFTTHSRFIRNKSFSSCIHSNRHNTFLNYVYTIKCTKRHNKPNIVTPSLHRILLRDIRFRKNYLQCGLSLFLSQELWIKFILNAWHVHQKHIIVSRDECRSRTKTNHIYLPSTNLCHTCTHIIHTTTNTHSGKVTCYAILYIHV